MTDELKNYQEANRSLTIRIDELYEELRKARRFREWFLENEKRARELEKKLNIKRSVIRVQGYKKDDLKTAYLLEIIDQIDTLEGLFIKVLI